MIRPSIHSQPGNHVPQVQHLRMGQPRQERSADSYGSDTPEQALQKAIAQHLSEGADETMEKEIVAILSLMQEFRLTMRKAWGAWIGYNANAVKF